MCDGMRTLCGYFDEPDHPAGAEAVFEACHTTEPGPLIAGMHSTVEGFSMTDGAVALREHIASHLTWLAKRLDDLGEAPLSSDAFGEWLTDEAARLRARQ